MTTLTLTGFFVTNDKFDDPITVTPATFTVEFPNEQAVINYSVLSFPPGDVLPLVDIGGTTAVSASINGVDILNDDVIETSIGFIETPQGIHVMMAFFDPVANFDAIFQIGGAGLALPTTVAQFVALDESIINAGTAFGPFAPGQDIPITSLFGAQISGDPFNLIEGTDGDDLLEGTDGDDVILTGDATPNGDIVTGSIGNDIIDMSDVDPDNGFVILDYSGLTGPIAVSIDGGENIGLVGKPNSQSDTLIDVQNPLFAGWTNGGLFILGTAADDTFTLVPQGEQWMSVQIGDGVDTLRIDGTGLVRLDFRNATQGIEIDLDTRQIANDGFGNAEVIAGTNSVWEVYGSGGDDIFTGSAANESYRYWGGNNDIFGGDGFDRLRYDVNQVQRIEADLELGIVQVFTTGGDFTDTAFDIESLRGSNGDDIIGGDTNNNRLEGRDGIDTFVHVGGFDTIVDFNASNETLVVRVAGLDQTSVDTALAGATGVAGGALVSFGSGSVFFQGLNVAQVTGINAVSGFEPTEVDLVVTLSDLGGSALDDAMVTFTPSAGAAQTMAASGAPGGYTLTLPLNSEGRVDAGRDFQTGDADVAVSDALNALRLAVGLAPSFGPATAFDFIAADVNHDGFVRVGDALDILRFAVGLETPNAPSWIFIDENQDLSGVNRDAVNYETGIDTGLIDIAGNLQLTGIVLGDVSGLAEV